MSLKDKETFVDFYLKKDVKEAVLEYKKRYRKELPFYVEDNEKLIEDIFGDFEK